MGHDGQRPFAVFDGERAAQGLVVAAVHVDGGPTLDGESGRDPAGPAQSGGIVVDHHRGEPIEPCPSGVLNGLGVTALLELGIADAASQSGHAHSQ